MYSQERGLSLLFFQPLKGNLIGGGVDFDINLIAPGYGRSILVCQRIVLDPHHEIIPYKLNGPLYLPLRLTSIRPAQDGRKAGEQ